MKVYITERRLEEYTRLFMGKALGDLTFYNVLHLLSLFFVEAGVEILYNEKESS